VFDDGNIVLIMKRSTVTQSMHKTLLLTLNLEQHRGKYTVKNLIRTTLVPLYKRSKVSVSIVNKCAQPKHQV